MRSQRNADVARQADGPKRGAQRRGQQGSLGEGNGAGLFFLYTLFADIVSKLAWVCLLDCFSKTTDYSRTFLKTSSDSLGFRKNP